MDRARGVLDFITKNSVTSSVSSYWIWFLVLVVIALFLVSVALFRKKSVIIFWLTIPFVAFIDSIGPGITAFRKSSREQKNIVSEVRRETAKKLEEKARARKATTPQQKPAS